MKIYLLTTYERSHNTPALGIIKDYHLGKPVVPEDGKEADKNTLSLVRAGTMRDWGQVPILFYFWTEHCFKRLMVFHHIFVRRGKCLILRRDVRKFAQFASVNIPEVSFEVFFRVFAKCKISPRVDIVLFLVSVSI